MDIDDILKLHLGGFYGTLKAFDQLEHVKNAFEESKQFIISEKDILKTINKHCYTNEAAKELFNKIKNE